MQKFPDVTQFGLVHDLIEDTRDAVKMCFVILVVVSGWWYFSPEKQTKIRICIIMRT
jgi:hypothetical protein